MKTIKKRRFFYSFELDFSGNSSIFDSDVLITDWSGTAYEFSFVTLKPSVFVDTKPKINNPKYQEIGIEPLEFSLRDQVGIRVDPKNMEGLSERIKELTRQGESFSDKLLSIREKYISNFGRSGEVGAKYILSAIKEKQNKKEK